MKLKQKVISPVLVAIVVVSVVVDENEDKNTNSFSRLLILFL